MTVGEPHVIGDARSEDSGSSITHPSGESTCSTEGRDVWTDGQGGSKMYNITDRRGDIRRLTTAHRNIQELLDRRRRLQLYLTNLLEKKQKRVEQIKKLKRLKQCSNEWKRKAEEKGKRLEDLTQKRRVRQKMLHGTVDSLKRASDNLSVTKAFFVHERMTFRQLQRDG